MLDLYTLLSLYKAKKRWQVIEEQIRKMRSSYSSVISLLLVVVLLSASLLGLVSGSEISLNQNRPALGNGNNRGEPYTFNGGCKYNHKAGGLTNG